MPVKKGKEVKEVKEVKPVLPMMTEEKTEYTLKDGSVVLSNGMQLTVGSFPSDASGIATLKIVLSGSGISSDASDKIVSILCPTTDSKIVEKAALKAKVLAASASGKVLKHQLEAFSKGNVEKVEKAKALAAAATAAAAAATAAADELVALASKTIGVESPYRVAWNGGALVLASSQKEKPENPGSRVRVEYSYHNGPWSYKGKLGGTTSPYSIVMAADLKSMTITLSNGKTYTSQKDNVYQQFDDCVGKQLVLDGKPAATIRHSLPKTFGVSIKV